VEALLTEAELEKLAGVERIHLVFKTHFVGQVAEALVTVGGPEF